MKKWNKAEPDYAGYEAAKRRIRKDLTPEEYQRAVIMLARKYHV